MRRARSDTGLITREADHQPMISDSPQNNATATYSQVRSWAAPRAAWLVS